MNIREILPLHTHPDGHGILFDPQTQELTVFNADDGQTVSIPMGAYGLLELVEAAASIIKEITYQEGEQ